MDMRRPEAVMTNFSSSVLIVDVLVSTVVFAVVGLVIVLTWGKDK